MLEQAKPVTAPIQPDKATPGGAHGVYGYGNDHGVYCGGGYAPGDGGDDGVHLATVATKHARAVASPE